MRDQANHLRRAVYDRKQYLINQLQRFDYFKTPDGKDINDLTLTELEQIHINVKCRIGRAMSQAEKEEMEEGIN